MPQKKEIHPLAPEQAKRLEVLADDYMFGFGHGDAEVKDAWSGFYGSVSGAHRRGGRRSKAMAPGGNPC